MNIFAFVRQKTQQTKLLEGWLGKYIKTHGMFDLLKISALSIVWLGIVFMYLYNVNHASTEWYFLRKANQDYAGVTSQLEILKTRFLAEKQENRKNLHNYRYEYDVVDVPMEIVYVPGDSELALLIGE